MSEYLLRFVTWTKLKVRIHKSDEIKFYFRERQIWYVSLGENIGSEQNGKNVRFERPVLVFKKFNRNLLWILPLTSQQKTGDYYHKFEFDGKLSSIILVQLRVISSKRLIRKMGIISVDNFKEIKEIIKNFI